MKDLRNLLNTKVSSKTFDWEVSIKIIKRYKTPSENIDEEVLRQEEVCKLEAVSYLMSKRMKKEIIERIDKICDFLRKEK